jgi:hypothetical protein
MFTSRITALAATVLAGTAIAVAAVAGAGTAAADYPLTQNDNAFLAQINADGIQADSPAVGVQSGHAVCQDLAGGRTSSQEVAEFGRENHDLTAAHARAFIVDSVRFYCPENARQLTA